MNEIKLIMDGDNCRSHWPGWRGVPVGFWVTLRFDWSIWMLLEGACYPVREEVALGTWHVRIISKMHSSMLSHMKLRNIWHFLITKNTISLKQIQSTHFSLHLLISSFHSKMKWKLEESVCERETWKEERKQNFSFNTIRRKCNHSCNAMSFLGKNIHSMVINHHY